MKHCQVIIVLLIGLSSFAQTKIPAVDQSPMDMSYYPATYPILKIQDKTTEPPIARVLYSRPHRNGRTVFGELVEFEKVWRLGANEATEIEFFRNVIFGGTPVPKGKYTLYCIPTPVKWTIIINKELDTWGSFIYDSKNDFLRIDVPVIKLTEPVESFALYFEKSTSGFDLVASWDTTSASIPITIPATKAPLKKSSKK